MNRRRALATIVGITEGVLGFSAVLLVLMIYFDFFDARSLLDIPLEILPLGLLVLSVAGFFFFMGGLFLTLEGLGVY